MGFLAPIAISSKHVLLKKFSGNYDAFSNCLDSFIPEYAILSIIYVILLLSSAEDSDGYRFDILDLLLGTAAGIFYCMGRICICVCVQIGIASCSQALMSTFALWQVLFGLIFNA